MRAFCTQNELTRDSQVVYRRFVMKLVMNQLLSICRFMIEGRFTKNSCFKPVRSEKKWLNVDQSCRDYVF